MFFNTLVVALSVLILGTLRALLAAALIPAKPTDITAPAVAPIVVSILVLLGSNVLSSDPCHTVENTKGVASVANAPTFKLATFSAC